MQGEPLTDVFVLIEGTLEVRVSGTLSTILPPYQLVGEASLLENLQSSGGSLQQARGRVQLRVRVWVRVRISRPGGNLQQAARA